MSRSYHSTRKFAGAVSIFEFLLSLFFVSFSITGNLINDTTTNMTAADFSYHSANFNYLGMLFFVFGLICAILYFRKTKEEKIHRKAKK